MDIRNTELGIRSFGTSLDCALGEVAPSAATGLPRGLSEALADPIVKSLMAPDRVDPKGLEDLGRRIAASLARRDPQNTSARLARRETPAASTGLAPLAKILALA